MKFISVKNIYGFIKSFFLLFIITLIILAAACSPKNISNNEHNSTLPEEEKITSEEQNNSKLTLDDIKSRYSDGDAGSIVNIYEQGVYILVEYLKEQEQYFDLYNLKTGDWDILPRTYTRLKLDRFYEGSSIRFVSDGVCTINGAKIFPFYFNCSRDGEVIESSNDFAADMQEKYYRIEDSVEFGNKPNEMISDIRITLRGIEMAFAPMKGYEGPFFTAYTTIPPIRTSYDEVKKQFIIEFQETKLDESFDTKKLSVNPENHFIVAIKVLKDGNNCKIILNLKEEAHVYSAMENKVNDDIPCVSFVFRETID